MTFNLFSVWSIRTKKSCCCWPQNTAVWVQFQYLWVFQIMVNKYCGKTLNNSFSEFGYCSIFKQTGRNCGTVDFFVISQIHRKWKDSVSIFLQFCRNKTFLAFLCWMYKWSTMWIHASQSIQKQNIKCCVLSTRDKRLLGHSPKKMIIAFKL